MIYSFIFRNMSHDKTMPFLVCHASFKTRISEIFFEMCSYIPLFSNMKENHPLARGCFYIWLQIGSMISTIKQNCAFSTLKFVHHLSADRMVIFLESTQNLHCFSKKNQKNVIVAKTCKLAAECVYSAPYIMIQKRSFQDMLPL